MATLIAPRDPQIDPADAAMVDRRALSIAAAALAANGNSDAFFVGDKGTLRLSQTTSAVSGTSPTLDVSVKTSADGVTWYTAGTFTQITGAGTERKCCAVDRWVRLDWTIGGSSTPTVTAGFDGEVV